MSSITLATSSGKWRRTVKRDDPLFSSLIPDLDDLPEQLVLSGSVAEILDEEWKLYEVIESTHLAIRREESSVLLRIKDNTYLPLPSFVTDVVSRGAKILPYSKIARLSRLLNLPSYVPNYLYLDEGTSQHDRIAHLRDIASKTYDWMLLGSYNCLQVVIRDAILKSGSSRGGMSDWCRFLIAQYYEAELRSLNEGRNVSIYDVNWKDTIVVLEEWEENHSIEEEALQNWLYAFELASMLSNSDRRTESIITFPLEMRYVPDAKEYYRKMEVIGMSEADLVRLYTSDLSYYNGQCDPRMIGLSLITEDQRETDLGVVGIVNGAIAHYVWSSSKPIIDTRKKMPRTLFPQLVGMYGMTIVGREGLVVILISLLYYLTNEKDEKKIRRVNYFCSLIEKYLKREQVAMVSVLPNARAFSLVLERLKK